MNSSRVDVESLPELKISQESFDALAEISGEDNPTVVNGVTWKRRVNQSLGSATMVICRYRTHSIGGAITIEMLRPVVIHALQGNSRDGYTRKSR